MLPQEHIRSGLTNAEPPFDMPPVADPQSILRHPFSAIFSTEAAVRILRELARSGNACSTGYLAERARVSIHTVRRSLERLVPLGVVEPSRYLVALSVISASPPSH